MSQGGEIDSRLMVLCVVARHATRDWDETAPQDGPVLYFLHTVLPNFSTAVIYIGISQVPNQSHMLQGRIAKSMGVLLGIRIYSSFGGTGKEFA